MKINLQSLRLKNDVHRTRLLHALHLFFVSLFVFARFLNGTSGFLWTLLSFALVLIYYNFFWKTIKNLYYTFWTFSSLLLIFIFFQIYFVEFHSATYSLLLAAIFLIAEMYVLSSPIYYPVVNWWDYDFRFRYDLPLKTKIAETEVEGRLTDLRRRAACIVLFEDISVGERLDLEMQFDEHRFIPTIEIMSKRQYSLGRPFHYGVSFRFNDNFSLNDYNQLLALWSRRRKLKQTQKSLGSIDHGV
jgi:hypothetical protein